MSTKINKVKGIDFSKKMQTLIERYNERREADTLRGEVLEDFTDEIIDLYHALKKEKESFGDLGIDFEEKAFYDILKALTVKYDFAYPEEKLIHLASEVKEVVDDKAKYTDWSKRDDIKAELKADLIMLLAENDYPPVDRDEVYKEILSRLRILRSGRNELLVQKHNTTMNFEITLRTLFENHQDIFFEISKDLFGNRFGIENEERLTHHRLEPTIESHLEHYNLMEENRKEEIK